jgi:micrococcal nuclease
MAEDEYDSAVEFSFEGQTFQAKVLSVYDGDTCTCAFPFGGRMFSWKCRLSGVDTPELRTRNQKEKEFGYKVRDALRERIQGKMVSLTCGDFDKYGRLLVTINHESLEINSWLIQEGFAFSYDGGSKREWFPDYIDGSGP